MTKDCFLGMFSVNNILSLENSIQPHQTIKAAFGCGAELGNAIPKIPITQLQIDDGL